MSKVSKITVSNLKAVSSLTADFNGCTAIITGGNNKGKSSFLKSLPERLQSVKPDVILKDGESEGFAEWTLTTGEKFRWEFDNKTKAGEKLIFVTKDNIKTSLTKEISNRYFPKTFDIDTFLKEGPKKQREMLQKIAGIDFGDLELRYKQAYDNRTFAGKQMEADKHNVSDYDPEMLTEHHDYMDLQKELAGIDSHNERYDTVESGMEKKKIEKEDCEREIKRLESLIYEQEQKIVGIDSDLAKGEEWKKNPANQPKTDEEANMIQERINAIFEANRKIDENNKAKVLNEKAEKSAKEYEDAQALVKSIEQERIDLIKKANLPVGFGFSEDGITYNGHSMTREQLSSSSLYIAALKLASASVGEVRTLHFDASYLDRSSLEEIETWANMNDLQLLIERPDFDCGEIKYEILHAIN